MRQISLKLIFSVFVLGGVFASFLIYAQDLEKICDLEAVDSECQRLSPTDCQALLNKCLKFYQEKGEFYEQKVKSSQREKRTLQSEINYLENKIKKLKNEIYHSNLMIKDLTLQIKDTEGSIDRTAQKIEEVKGKIAEILRLINEYDKKSVVEILLEEESLSSFFDELAALEALSYQHQELLKNIKDLKNKLEEEKTSLSQEKDSLEKIVLISSLKAKESESLRKEKEWLLQKTKGQESLYQAYLKEVQQKAGEIRKRIFELAQVPESEAPSYEEAYALAKSAELVTGVRPALLLGLLEVESAIGKNVGQCNCPGHAYCRHPEISWKQVMPKSNWEAFSKITRELGLDPNSTPVSCAINGGKVQWGGAMGPAQFMPNTWLSLGYKERVEKITGVKPANPWRVKDAFLAAALYLADWGASSRRLQDEIGAVTAYLCGTSRMTSRCRQAGGKGYRYTVMQKANQWEKWIEQGVFNK
jgi:peptidoglycan hydrolase CwlO-like protein